MAWRDLTTLYRGQPWSGPGYHLKKAIKRGVTDYQGLGGQWWTTNLESAKDYARRRGVIRSMDVPQSSFDRFSRYENRLSKIPKYKGIPTTHMPDEFLVPKSTLKKYPSKLNLGQTLKHKLGWMDYPGKMLKIGWQQYGDDYTLPEKLSKFARSDVGPALKNVGLKGLGYLASLPVQAGIMALTPTTANADDEDMNWRDFRRLAMKEVPGVSFHSKRRPGTPFVPRGDGPVEQVRTREPTPSGNGGGGWSPGVGGGNYQPQRATRAGGFTDPGKGSYGPWKSRGGIIGAF